MVAQLVIDKNVNEHFLSNIDISKLNVFFDIGHRRPVDKTSLWGVLWFLTFLPTLIIDTCTI